MNISKERSRIEKEYEDKEINIYILFMCKKCKFYDKECTKKRIIRECAVKGLKNKE